MEKKDASRKRKLATQGKDSTLGQNKLTLQRRLELMRKLEDGAKVSDVASDFNVTTQYVYKLRKSESETVLKRVRELRISPSCFRTTVPKYHDLDCRLMEWIEVARTRYEETKFGISGKMIQEQAKQVAAEMKLEGFRASNGWLQKFIHRHHLTKKKPSPEEAVAGQSPSRSSGRDEGPEPPKARVTSSLNEADIQERLKEVRSELLLRGRDGEYKETNAALSRAMQAFERERMARREAGRPGGSA